MKKIIIATLLCASFAANAAGASKMTTCLDFTAAAIAMFDAHAEGTPVPKKADLQKMKGSKDPWAVLIIDTYHNVSESVKLSKLGFKTREDFSSETFENCSKSSVWKGKAK